MWTVETLPPGKKLLVVNGFFCLKFNSNISLDNPNKLREENSWL